MHPDPVPPPLSPALADDMATSTPDWLPLLRQLTEASPRWLSWKNVESALTGVGDIDSIAPRADWDLVTSAFRRWAAEYRLEPVVICPHAPFLLHLIALGGARPEFYELDVNRRKVFLGSTLFRPPDLLPLSVIDERGFRRLRPGVEGLLKLVQNGARRDGRPNEAGLQAKKIAQLLREDPEGVRAGARLFGPAARSVLRASDALVAGSWDRRAVLVTEAWSLVRAAGEPDAVLARVRFRINRRRCPVLHAVVRGGRRVPGDPDRWLHEVAKHHRVFETRT